MGTETREARAGRLAALRSGAWDPPRPPNPQPDQPTPAIHQPPTRHCYLESEDHRRAVEALLLAWEQREDGWWGLVTTSRMDDGAIITMTRWIRGDRLRPAR